MPAADSSPVAAPPSAPYFPEDPSEPHYRWHAEQITRLLDRVRDPQVRRWLAPLMESLRLRYLALHERLDTGPGATVSDHEWRDFADAQRRVDAYLDARGNPLDAAINHTLRRVGRPPEFGHADRLAWQAALTPAQIAAGRRPPDLPRRFPAPIPSPTLPAGEISRLAAMTDAEFHDWEVERFKRQRLANVRGRAAAIALTEAVAAGLDLQLTPDEIAQLLGEIPPSSTTANAAALVGWLLAFVILVAALCWAWWSGV